ncbi:MAG: threonylcarbamoyl-AMP synthase [Bacteroidetes bacterium HGW-Bacteroidetes-1]|jgi:L-threonylcarbamoyladenylate synthase|nr:MAG: threonylcarbamoyl-AMP synthase [Bacteroidetes bacterium HGW-Bacteroidetes-1]
MVTQKDIEEAAKIIRNGGLVAFPTETVYGLGANAYDANAVAKIFIAKQRPSFDPLIVHICHNEDIGKLSLNEDERVYKLAKNFWPGPLTIVVPKSNIIPDIVTSGLESVGLRMPDNDIALRLIDAAGCPIAAPSANKFGKLSPTSAEHVRKQLPELSCILDSGRTIVGVESTVITLETDGFRILRPGAITSDHLSKVLPMSGKLSEDILISASPGLMKSHYSPEKPVYILGEHDIPQELSNAAFLSFNGSAPEDYKTIAYLSHSGNLQQAAVNLFGALHWLEESDIDFIVSEAIPEQGIGIAIMDRLRKAAYRFHLK